MNFRNAIKHFNIVRTHRKYVRKFCFMCGLYKQGLLHDLSKYSPIEFFESVKYYQGTRSPIDACKEENGYSMAWLHHKGRNFHHYEAWTDNYDKGTTTIKMPWKYALEQFCDYLGAGVAYSGGLEKFSIREEIKWWKEKRRTAKMHPDTLRLMDDLFISAWNKGIKETLIDRQYLNNIRRTYENGGHYEYSC